MQLAQAINRPVWSLVIPPARREGVVVGVKDVHEYLLVDGSWKRNKWRRRGAELLGRLSRDKGLVIARPQPHDSTVAR